MKFTVVWKPRAENELTELWIAASDKNLVAHAAHQIDSELRDGPLEVGESREGKFRILCVLPLVVSYEVIEADCIVRVVRVRAI